MKKLELTSVFSDEIINYLTYREVCGIKQISNEYQYYRKLDYFIHNEKIKKISLTKTQAIQWIKPLENESEKQRYKRINSTKNFFKYLLVKGYNVFQFRDIKSPKSTFEPHIYTNNEIIRYFDAVDNYHSNMNRKHCVQLPILFRILYCCGTRATETLMIKKKDIDLQNGIIKLTETKYGKHRYVVMSKSLSDLMKQFANKAFYDIPDDGYIFRSILKPHFSCDWLNDIHIKILKHANIPYLGGGHGPRIHDWRHTFSVNSFKQMIDSGIDMYVALPILSTYLGHQTIYSTERYLRLTISMYPYIEEKISHTLNEIFGEVHL